MTKEEMLSAIYDEMADKTLSDGCLVFSKEVPKDIFSYGPCFFFIRRHIDDYKIIGHPVRIGDVLEYIRLKNIWDINPVTDEWDYPRLPIEEQSDECIEFVYNLIKK